jgi:hypothetical protein
MRYPKNIKGIELAHIWLTKFTEIALLGFQFDPDFAIRGLHYGMS